VETARARIKDFHDGIHDGYTAPDDWCEPKLTGKVVEVYPASEEAGICEDCGGHNLMLVNPITFSNGLIILGLCENRLSLD
jgi:hypothetical protein